MTCALICVFCNGGLQINGKLNGCVIIAKSARVLTLALLIINLYFFKDQSDQHSLPLPMLLQSLAQNVVCYRLAHKTQQGLVK
ncbi:hypothetical protein PSOS111911_15870 [Pseudoalteromonas ostreae]